ncbi:MAG: 2-hydroxyacyl-CoA dehydratase [Desulfobacterales bacterium]|nr:2-hydroxyacyl-CoA dehydratase [Desulfobacterales bacterium]
MIKKLWIYIRYWLFNWFKMLWMGLKHGPFDMIRDLKKYPWMLSLINANTLLLKLVSKRTPRYAEANAMVISEVVSSIIKQLEGVFYDKDKMILHEDMVPPEIFRAMGLSTWMIEFNGILMPLVEPRSMEQYIDISENEGVPPDICSLPKSSMGFALKGHLPEALAMVTSNLPCDGGMAAYTLIEKKLNIPVFRLDIPYNFYNERAVEYFSNELKQMIAWLEQHTPGRMNWDRLREICEERNRMAEAELELWDLIRTKPAPMAAEPIYLSHLWGFNLAPGQKIATRLFEKIGELAKLNLKEGLQAVANEKYRALLWNPPTLHFIDLFAWAEKAYGVSLLMDSMSYNRQPFIDTKTPDSMLKGLSNIIMQGPMARHTRGPSENYFNDMFHIYKHFNLDMIWIAGHIGCKNTQALNGILREKCRESKIPLLIIDYDLSDTRIVGRDGIIAQVEQFMENIMKAKRLDK